MRLSARSRSVRHGGKLESASLSVIMKKDLDFCFLSDHGHVKFNNKKLIWRNIVFGMMVKMFYCLICNYLYIFERIGQILLCELYLEEYSAYALYTADVFLFLVKLNGIRYCINNFSSVLMANKIQVGSRAHRRCLM